MDLIGRIARVCAIHLGSVRAGVSEDARFAAAANLIALLGPVFFNRPFARAGTHRGRSGRPVFPTSQPSLWIAVTSLMMTPSLPALSQSRTSR